MRALIVEDDPRFGAYLEKLLSRDGFLADWEADPEIAREKGFDDGYAVIILDLMLTPPGEPYGKATDGFSLLRRWRDRGVRTPVLVLTASRTDLEDTAMSYDCDADYQIKQAGPQFDQLILAWARSRSRTQATAPSSAEDFGRVRIDPRMKMVLVDGAPIDLTQTEFNVLAELVRADGDWRTVDHIAKSAFGPNCENPNAQVYVYIQRLRAKLPVGSIANRRGFGYRFALSEASAGDGRAPAPNAAR